MKAPKLEWRPNTACSETGSSCYAGKWCLGYTYYNSGRSNSDPDRDKKEYGASVNLSGLKVHVGFGTSDEAAQKHVEAAIKHWFKHLTVEVKNDKS